MVQICVMSTRHISFLVQYQIGTQVASLHTLNGSRRVTTCAHTIITHTVNTFKLIEIKHQLVDATIKYYWNFVILLVDAIYRFILMCIKLNAHIG